MEPDDRSFCLFSTGSERPYDCGAAEQRDELASSCVEHGASSPLWTGGISNDHQPANGPCSRFSAPQPTTEDN